MKTHWLALVGLLLTSCASSGSSGSNFGGPPGNFHPFPALGQEGNVNAKAEYAYPAEQERVFLTNLLEDVGIIPVRLTVSLSGKDADDVQIRLATDSMNLRLYLQHGVSLPVVDLTTFMDDLSTKQGDEVRKRKFNGDHLSRAETTGYVYFALVPASEFEVDGDQLLHTSGGITRRVDIDQSLLAFDVTIQDRPQPFFVGIRP